jgi:antitoxin MazE
MLKCRYNVDTGILLMTAHVQRWGNSLAVRIPKALADELGLKPNDEIDLSVHEGRIILSPSKKKQFNLDDLLAGVTHENIHKEWDTDDAQGNEVW